MQPSRAKNVPNLWRNLKRKFPAATISLLDAVVQQAHGQGPSIYLVGGSVRDLLLNRPNLDLDLVLEGDAIRLGHALVKKFGGHLVSHKAFATAVWWLPQDQAKLFRALRVPVKGKHRVRLPDFIDLIASRRETYQHPAALPRVQFAGIREDLYRRDFTINTMAIRLDGSAKGQLLDPWGGLQDLRGRKLRTLHPLSFSDDPTRILRMLRLASRLGFNVEIQTRRQLKTYLPILKKVSGERIRTELELALLESMRVSVLRSMQRLGVLKTIHPRLRISSAAEKTLAALHQKLASSSWVSEDFSVSDIGFVLWFMHFLATDVAAISDRLSFRADLRDAILSAVHLNSLRTKLPSLRPSRAVAVLEKVPDLAIYAFYLVNRGNKIGKVLKTFVAKWRVVRPKTDGNRLKKLGLKPGPGYKRILEQLRSAWLDGEVRTSQQEDALLKKLLHEQR
jgi:tRNA nucleotidyltransferase (CCA-adding enzyme)